MHSQGIFVQKKKKKKDILKKEEKPLSEEKIQKFSWVSQLLLAISLYQRGSKTDFEKALSAGQVFWP